MTNETINNEQLHEEAAVTPTPNGTQGEQPRQDQHAADQSSEKKTRTPYDGTKEHGVVPKNVNDVEHVAKAKVRLRLRLTHLNDEYNEKVVIIQDPEKSIREKALAVKEANGINEKLQKLQEVASKLNARIPELEELAKDSIDKFNPASKVEVTI